MKKQTPKTTRSIKDRFYTLYQSIWLFPLLVFMGVIVLSFIGVSGSSIGVYDGVLNNDPAPSLGVVRSKPQPIRSDEWLVMTQMTVSQYENNFPVINNSIGTGQDMAVVLDVPYKDWSVLFKPQNLIFFIAPLDFAFAFKWWFLAALLMVGAYTFALSILRKKILLSALIGIVSFLSPMVQWWYQSVTIIPLAMAFFISAILVAISKGRVHGKKLFFLHVAFIYCSVVFAMAMYPPFQIPILLVVASLYISLFINNWLGAKTRTQKRKLLKQLAQLVLSSVVIIAIIALFIVQHLPTVKTITNTTYPGARTIQPGNYPLFHVLGSHLGAFHQSNTSSSNYKELGAMSANQSEFSNFIVPVIPLMFLGLLLVMKNWRQQENKTLRNVIIGMLVILGVFLLHLFAPAGEVAYKFIALNIVPHARLLMGVGFGSIVLLVLLISYLSKEKFKLSNKQTAAVLGAIALFYCLITIIIATRNPGFITYKLVAIVLTGSMLGFFILFLTRRFRLALTVLVIISAASVIRVNPLDRNLDELTSTQFSQFIQHEKHEHPEARWATNDIGLENYPLANGAKSLSGTYLYPQHSIWKALDKNNKYYPIYNRYAHVFFKFDESQKKPVLTLLSSDTFQVSLSTCDGFLDKYNVKYIYGRTPVSSRCVKPITTYKYGLNTIYVYARAPIEQ